MEAWKSVKVSARRGGEKWREGQGEGFLGVREKAKFVQGGRSRIGRVQKG